LSYTKKNKNDFVKNWFFLIFEITDNFTFNLPKYQLESLEYQKNAEAENQNICTFLNS